MEQARRNGDFCSGIIFWMMNDCRPAASGWSLIDYYGLPKNAFYAFKRCAKPVIASIDCEEDTYRVYLINDGAEKQGRVSIRILSADRKSVREYAGLDPCVRGSSSAVIFEGKHLLDENEVLICDVSGSFGSDRAFYCHGGLEICPAEIDVCVDRNKKTIRVTARESYVHAVVISGNFRLDDNCFSLLPYESRTIVYRPLDMDADDNLSVDAYTLV